MPSKDSKKNFATLRDQILAQRGKEYWRSVEEFVDAPEFEEFVKEEYPQHAEEWDNSLSRRNFIKVMGASLAFAGLTGCVIQPAEKIIPYVRANEDILPGKPLFFATAMSLGGVATGLLGKSYDGRPIKIEGSPEHPGSLGATDVLAQASLLGLYDPDRSQAVTYRGAPKTWQNFTIELRSAIDANRADGGAGIRFLTETVTSPTLIAQFKQIAAELPNSRWTQYEPVNNDNAIAGAKMAFGTAVQTVYKIDAADKILSLDKDIFSGFNVRYMKDFAKKRAFSEEKKEINRLYAVETTLTLTGAKSDHRLAVKPSQMAEIAKAVAAAVGVSGANAAGLSAEQLKWIGAMAADLKTSRGKSIVIPGDNQPPVVHALAHSINGALGNVGQTVIYTEPLAPFTEKTQIEQLRELVTDIDAGKVKILVVLGGNPVYNTPADLKLNADRMNKIPLRVHLGLYNINTESQGVDETAELCQWHVNEKHYLESWGDSRAYDGTVTFVQPIIQPLYEGKNIYEFVQLFMKENFDKKDLDIIKENWQKQGFGSLTAAAIKPAPAAPSASPSPTNQSPHSSPLTAAAPAVAPAATGKSFEDNWRKIVHDGIVPNSALPAKTVTATTAFLSQPEVKPANGGSLEISILPDPSVYDGRFTNNGWLQELPNPLTKITWDNVALVSPATARRLKLNGGNDAEELTGGAQGTSFINTKGGNQFSDLVTLTYQGAEISKPVAMWIAPGQPDDVITIYMGYGRDKAGKIGSGLGYSAFDVMRSDAMNYGSGEIKLRGEQATIASTQIHFNMEGRDLIRVLDVENLEKTTEELKKKGEEESGYDKSMYEPFNYSEFDWQHKWGMSIDLNNCVGCNACVIACQSENNIPVVGKEQVNRSREMHWMRIDAYFEGEVNDPGGPHFQPLLCQQCEQAPCETVCPVHATVHSEEGLNDMVYNRCVGTRYCSNNCPYKVRRFNFLLYQDWNTPQYKLMRNPEVTVRSRGVMEKCTYCMQRIAAARIEGRKDNNRRVRDGEVITACQSVCPTEAITFGDMNDPNSRVSIKKKDERNYVLLNELNTQPRTTYLAGLKNQNKEMPDYKPTKMGGEASDTHSENAGHGE